MLNTVFVIISMIFVVDIIKDEMEIRKMVRRYTNLKTLVY